MRNLFALLARTHRWLLFLALWGVALGWVNTTYSHHRTALAGWSLRASGSWLDAAGNVQEWTHLAESNRLVMLENARLRAELESLKERRTAPWQTGDASVLRSPGSMPGWGGDWGLAKPAPQVRIAHLVFEQVVAAIYIDLTQSKHTKTCTYYKQKPAHDTY